MQEGSVAQGNVLPKRRREDSQASIRSGRTPALLEMTRESTPSTLYDATSARILHSGFALPGAGLSQGAAGEVPAVSMARAIRSRHRYTAAGSSV